MKAKATSAIFLVILLGLAIANLFTPDLSFSEQENRVLKGKPEFSVHSLFSGRFTKEFDEYITDQFIARDKWVGLKTLSEVALQKRSSNGVYFAKDGYLIEAFDSVDRERFEKNLSFVADFSEAMSTRGIRTHTMLVPTAPMILSDRLPSFAPEIDQRQLLDQAAKALPGFIDVSQDLSLHSSEYIYYRTDHHWTSLGAYYAYNSFLEQTGHTVRPIEDYVLTVLSDQFYGTTWSKANLYTTGPDTITGILPRDLGPLQVWDGDENQVRDSIYESSFLETKDKYSVFLNANQPLTQITTSTQNGKHLMVIKDSYANCFTQFLLKDYEKITVLDPRFYHSSFQEYAAENGVTDCLVLYNLKNFTSDANIYFLST